MSADDLRRRRAGQRWPGGWSASASPARSPPTRRSSCCACWRAEGADVVVMLTPAAATFVGPLTFEALTRHPVETDVLGLLPDGRIGHIVVADTADAIVVAPATAHWLGAMADGLGGRRRHGRGASPPLRPSSSPRRWTATCGPTRRPGPTSHGCRRTSATGWSRPRCGPLASGAVRHRPPGRAASGSWMPSWMPSGPAGPRTRRGRPAADRRSDPRDADLAGRHVVVTAGGTAEPIDPVRFIGNRSSGQHGRRDRRGGARPRCPGDDRGRARRGAAALRRPRGHRPRSTAAMRAAVLDAVIDHPAGRAGDGRRRRGLPTEARRRGQADAGRVADPGARADRGHPRGGRGRAPQSSSASPGASSASPPRRGRSIARREAAPEGRGPAGRQRRRRGGSGSARTRTASRSSPRTAPGTTSPLLTKREVADRLLDRVATLLDERDTRAHTARTRTETRR